MMESYGRKADPRYGAIVRPIGRILLTMRVQPLLNGSDKVSATTASGREIWSQEYEATEECRVLEVRNAIRVAALRANLCTWQSTLDLVRTEGLTLTKPLRGNQILKGMRMKPRNMPVLINPHSVAFCQKKGRQ